MRESITLLLALKDACAEGRPAPPAVALWFAEGVNRAVLGVRLDESLGLAGVGMRALASRYARVLRDRHLVAAAQCVALEPDATNWTKATRLAPVLKRFANREWPGLQRLTAAPADWPAWKQHAFAAARCGLSLPCGAHQLKRLLDAVASTPPYSYNSEPDKDPSP